MGLGTVKRLATYPGVSVSRPGQGVKYKTRGKMKAELSVLGWLHPTACPPQHPSSAFLLWGVHFPCLEPLWPAPLPKLVLAPWGDMLAVGWKGTN